jgi:thiol-disulfide isomerase/thioredoxin
VRLTAPRKKNLAKAKPTKNDPRKGLLSWRTHAAVGAGSVVLTGAVLAAGFSVWSGLSKPESTAVSLQTMPRFVLADFLTGKSIRLDDYRGRPLVVNFLAFSCAPCVSELPMVSAAAKAHPDIAFLGIHTAAGRDTDKAVAFVRRMQVSFPVAYDKERTLDASIYGLPTTVMFDAAGDEVYRQTGAISRTELEDQLQRLR